jgi:DNA sulfur modification protein DndB
MSNSYAFAAIRGIQGGRAFYMAMMRLNTISCLLGPARLRSATPWQNPILKRRRIDAIVRYILAKPHAYALSPLVASIDGAFRFEASGEHRFRSVGTLFIDISAILLLSDGWHRFEALREVLRNCPTMGNETIAVMILPDAGLERWGEMVADLNRHDRARTSTRQRDEAGGHKAAGAFG